MWYILHWNIITDSLLCVKFHMSILFNNILGTENTKCHIIQNGFKKRQHLYTEIYKQEFEIIIFTRNYNVLINEHSTPDPYAIFKFLHLSCLYTAVTGLLIRECSLFTLLSSSSSGLDHRSTFLSPAATSHTHTPSLVKPH